MVITPPPPPPPPRPPTLCTVGGSLMRSIMMAGEMKKAYNVGLLSLLLQRIARSCHLQNRNAADKLNKKM